MTESHLENIIIGKVVYGEGHQDYWELHLQINHETGIQFYYVKHGGDFTKVETGGKGNDGLANILKYFFYKEGMKSDDPKIIMILNNLKDKQVEFCRIVASQIQYI